MPEEQSSAGQQSRTPQTQAPPPPLTPAGPSSGRRLSENLRADTSDNPLIPEDDQLETIAASLQVNKVATSETITTILETLKKRHANSTANDLVSLAWACYHNGSSKYTILDGASPNNAPLAEIKDIVENHCTLRQFCTYYSKVCYNMGKSTSKPPANWNAKGFTEDTKYAAFDFFNGVLNPAAPAPRSGMKHKPTAAEIKAHSVNATMAILESRTQANHFSNRGNMMAMQQIKTQPTNPLITFD